MYIKNLFSIPIGVFNDINFTSKVLSISKPLLDTNNTNRWEYNNTYDNIKAKEILNNNKFISNFIFNLSKTYSSQINIDLPEIDIELFVSRMKKGDKHASHFHPGALFSGVCYLNIKKGCSPIEFHNPNPQIEYFKSFLKNTSFKDNMRGGNQRYSPQTGDILIWEGWVSHSVPYNNCDCRETLVFNIGTNKI